MNANCFDEQTHTPTDQVLLSVEQARKLRFGNGLSRARMYRLARKKGFPAIRLGRRILIPLAQLDAWIAEQARKGAAREED